MNKLDNNITKNCDVCFEEFPMDTPIHDMSNEKNVEKYILIKKNGLSPVQMVCGDVFHSVCIGSLVEKNKTNSLCSTCHHDFKLVSSEEKRIVKYIDHMVKFTNTKIYNKDKVLWELPMTRDNYNDLVVDEGEDLLLIDQSMHHHVPKVIYTDYSATSNHKSYSIALLSKNTQPEKSLEELEKIF